MTRKPANRIAQGDIISGSQGNAIATPTVARAGFRAEMTFFSHACLTRPDLGYCPVWSVGIVDAGAKGFPSGKHALGARLACCRGERMFMRWGAGGRAFAAGPESRPPMGVVG